MALRAAPINPGAERLAAAVHPPARLPRVPAAVPDGARPEHGATCSAACFFGARVSLQVGIVTVGMAIVIGSLIGADRRLLQGLVDNVLMRIMDVLLAFPASILAIFLATAFQALEVPFLGDPLFNAMLAIGIVAIPVYARVMRASVLSVRERDFVIASRAARRVGRRDPPSPRAAERADAAHRAGHARDRDRHPRGRRTVVPRARPRRSRRPEWGR